MRYPSELPANGLCRCGSVQLRVTKPALLTLACHCPGCQGMTDNAFSLSAALPADGIDILRSELVRGGLQTEHQHLHCACCKSWVMVRPAGLDWLVNLWPGMLDPHVDFVPFIETHTVTRLPRASTPARHAFPGFPDATVFEPLVAELGTLP